MKSPFIGKDYDFPRSHQIALEYLSKFKGKILELGCSDKPMKKYLMNVVTLDINPENKPDVVADAEDMKVVSDKSFDVVYSCHFLEHVYNPEKVLKECNRILKPNGILFFIVPVVPLNRLWKDGDDYNPHQHSFTRENIENLLKRTGFELIEFHYRLWIKPNFLERFLGNLLRRGDIFFIARKV